MFRLTNLKGRLSSGLVAIYSSRMILNIGSALMGLFLPIFLFQVFDHKLSYTLVYFLIYYSTYLFFVPLGAKFSLNGVGIKWAIVVSTIFGAIYFVMLYFITGPDGVIKGVDGINHTSVLVFLVISILFTALQDMTYWVPVHTEMSQLTNRSNRTKQLAILGSSSIIFSALCPLFAGWLLVTYGFNILFVITILITMLSIVPLFYLPPIEEKFSWTYLKTWKEFFSKKRQKTILAFMGDGAEGAVSSIIWPIYIWEILKGNYFSVGAISSAIVITTVILELLVGKFADSGKREKILHWGTILYSLGWVIKIFIGTAFQIFVVSAYQSLTRIFTRTPFDSIFYEHAADQGHYVDEYSVIHEMALMVGRVLIILLILILVPTFGIGFTFVLAAISTLLMNFLIDKKTVQEIAARVG